MDKVGTQILAECLNCCILIVCRSLVTAQDNHSVKSSREDLITLYSRFPWVFASYNLQDSPPPYYSPSSCSYGTIEHPNMWVNPWGSLQTPLNGRPTRPSGLCKPSTEHDRSQQLAYPKKLRTKRDGVPFAIPRANWLIVLISLAKNVTITKVEPARGYYPISTNNLTICFSLEYGTLQCSSKIIINFPRGASRRSYTYLGWAPFTRIPAYYCTTRAPHPFWTHHPHPPSSVLRRTRGVGLTSFSKSWTSFCLIFSTCCSAFASRFGRWNQ